MKKLLFILLFSLFLPSHVLAQQQNSPKTEYYQAKVTHVIDEGTKKVGNQNNLYQKLEVELENGPDKVKKIQIEHGGMIIITKDQLIKENEKVILTKTEKSDYRFYDRYRIPNVLWLGILFFAIVLIIAGKKGVGSFAGMTISLLIIMLFIVPQIIQGADPLLISIIGSVVIMIVTLYLAHGFSQQTTLALIATCVSLFLTGLLATFFVNIAGLSGLGTEDSYSLLQGFGSGINLKGLLLGGIIIGTLGVLDDTTTTQSATIHHLSEANPSYSVRTLFTKGMTIGREHIASLVNTLVLAYAGAAIGVFIYISLGLKNNMQPWWVIFNSELLMEEIVRTIAGSIGLILAVPITTVLAAFFAKNEIKIK